MVSHVSQHCIDLGSRYRVVAAGVLTVLLCVLTIAPYAQAQNGTRIAAVVNEDAISLYDVNARTAMVMRMSGIPDSPESRQRIVPQILRALIDEALKTQEAERLGVELTPEESTDAVRQVERNNGLPEGQFIEILKQGGVDPSTALNQIHSEVRWQKAMQLSLRGRIDIGDVEVDVYLDTLRRNLGKPEYLVAEIFLPVDNPAQDAEALDAVLRLDAQIRQGARFSAVAQQFSGGPTAGQGGDLGWIGPEDVDPEVFQAVSLLQPGQMTPPVRSFGGYHLVLVREVRVAGASNPGASMSLSRVLLPPNPTTTMTEAFLQSVRNELTTDIASCEEMHDFIRDMRIPDSGPLGMVDPSTLPPDARQALVGLRVGQVSEPIYGDLGVSYLMICEQMVGGVPGREMVRERLAQQRLQDTMQRRLRDLRQQAVIDMRM